MGWAGVTLGKLMIQALYLSHGAASMKWKKMERSRSHKQCFKEATIPNKEEDKQSRSQSDSAIASL